MFDILMYLFENYMESDVDIAPDQEYLMEELLQAGFPEEEVDKAFEWLESLALLQDKQAPATNADKSMRVYSELEAFRLDVECLGRRRLHPVGEFEAVDAGGEVALSGAFGEVKLVEARQQVELATLLDVVHPCRPVQVWDRIALRSQPGALKHARQEPGPPVERVSLGQPTSLWIRQHDERRQVAVG